MSKPSRVIVRVVGILAIFGGMLGVAFILHADSHVAGTVIARPLSWLPPLATVLVIAGVAWILLAQHAPDGRDDRALDSTTCPSCEREVLGKWRMCPYCGAMLDAPKPTITSHAGHAERSS
jgi:hypothetical protein